MFKVYRLLWNLIIAHLYWPQDWHKFFTCLYLNMMTPQQSTWASLQNIKNNPNRSSHRLCACHLRRAGSQCWPSPPNSLAGSTLGATGSWGGNPEQHRYRHHFLHCDSHDHQAIMACSRILKTTVWATTSDQQLQFALPAHFITLSVIWTVLWNFTEMNMMQNTRFGNRTEINLFPATWFQ